MGGNIGTAILSLEPLDEGRAYVIECSSYQIDLAPTLDPSVGILLNITEDHLDRHGTLQHYAAVKERLVAGVQADGTAIVGVDDEWCAAAADRMQQAGKRLLRVSVLRAAPRWPLSRRRNDHAGRGRQRPRRSPGSETSARCAACTMRRMPPARPARRSRSGSRSTPSSRDSSSFPGLAHRMEQVGRKGRVLFVNDSKATNADSAAQALACFSDIFWIAGGKPKTGGIASLARFFPRIRKAYLIGEAAAGFAAELDGRVPHVTAGTLDRAVELAAHDAEACGLDQPVVLLSPACASFDQYRNFEIRGDKFRDLVRALPDLVPMSSSS